MKTVFMISVLFLLIMFPLMSISSISKSFAQEPFLLTLIQNAFGSKQNDPRWNPFADMNKDGVVNMKDIALYCGLFAQKPLIISLAVQNMSTLALPTPLPR